MASYSTRQRDPLLDSTTQAAIEKRSKELLGIGLVALGVMAAMLIGSYSPDDPNFMLASDAPVQNWLGHFGASIAAPLFMIVGWAAWGLSLTLITWGGRLAMHYGEDRVMSRVIFAPIAVAIGAIYASTLSPGAEWTHSFGMGGLFGDTVLSIILTVVPLPAAIGIKLLSLVFGVLTLAIAAFVLGFTKVELRAVGRFLLIGLVVLYTMLLRLLGQGAGVSMKAAQGVYTNMQDRREQLRVERAEAQAEAAAIRAIPDPTIYRAPPSDPATKARVAAVVRANPVMATGREHVMPTHAPMPMRNEPPLAGGAAVPRAPAPLAAPPRAQAAPEAHVAGGLRALMPNLLRRAPEQAMPEPEWVENPPMTAHVPAADGDRIKARISDAIRSRAAPPPPPPPVTKTANGLRIEPTLTAGKGPRPLVLNPVATRVMAEPTLQMAADRAPMQEWVDDEQLLEEVDGFDQVADYADDLAQPDYPVQPAAPQVLNRRPMPAVEAQPLVAEPLFDAEPQQAAPMQKPFVATQAMQVPVPEPKKVVQHSLKRSVLPSRQAQAEAQPKLKFDDSRPEYETPPLNLLMNPIEIQRHHLSDEALEENARMLESVLDDYGVKGEIVSVRPGPVVTMYELEPAPGLKASRVIGLADDIARSMSALSARVSTVPGRSVIGIELPNANREKVVLREILAARDFGDSAMKLPLALGKDIGGDPIIANLAKMPHLLIAGTTGSGKSVAINTMILSLLYKLTPEECRLIMIDPKMLELSVYDGIPHLLSPVVTDPKKAVVALKWVVGEMEERYRKMSKMGVRNIEGYNGRVKDALARGEMFSRTVQTGFDEETGDPIFETDEFQPEAMPYIVVIVDEMADLMMVAGKEIEACIQRLAQMARASGIHLIMATQRPSVDVITGTIKANFPTRISFQVTSKIDSRTILGEQGAEQLLGMGDMLYMAGGGRITRIHGPFVSDEEVEEIVNFLKGFGPPEYFSGVVDGPDEDKEADIDLVLGLGSGSSDTEDAMYDTAVAIVAKDRKCSTSYIQRKLGIGYNKAAKIVEQMEEQGVVSPANHVGKREILVPEAH
jgi:S-DNA-T family DNA segregation ATPase FtsK/SpoIIIE